MNDFENIFANPREGDIQVDVSLYQMYPRLHTHLSQAGGWELLHHTGSFDVFHNIGSKRIASEMWLDNVGHWLNGIGLNWTIEHKGADLYKFHICGGDE